MASSADISLGRRSGPRSLTTTTNPHTQLDQQPATPLSAGLVEEAQSLQGVFLAPSRRAPLGTVGFCLRSNHAKGPVEAFMLGAEFCHVHPGPDHSLHLTLPEPLRSNAIAAGWVEPHPLAGYSSVSPRIVLLYAPRDIEEFAVAVSLIRASWSFASGQPSAGEETRS